MYLTRLVPCEDRNVTDDLFPEGSCTCTCGPMQDYEQLRINKVTRLPDERLVTSFFSQSINPHIATYYTNRALCYIKLGQWDLAVEDCQKAIQIDPASIKAHFFMGQALSELENYDDAIAALKRGKGVYHNNCFVHVVS